jgi:hypothetical protein
MQLSNADKALRGLEVCCPLLWYQQLVLHSVRLLTAIYFTLTCTVWNDGSYGRCNHHTLDRRHFAGGAQDPGRAENCRLDDLFFKVLGLQGIMRKRVPQPEFASELDILVWQVARQYARHMLRPSKRRQKLRPS